MANSLKSDLMSFGMHCSYPFCRRLDFLPFKCDTCEVFYCVNHFKPLQHNCQKQQIRENYLPQCPLCFQYVVKGINGNDDNTQVERHIESGCKILIQEKRKKNKCSRSGCKLTSLIPIQCNNCYQSYCVGHRHPADHRCVGQKNSQLVGT
ncbi:AN1-type zinc finger protein 2B-like isoform X1 [Hydra vulgaris]|uniref:AN1-type zinc finger protein 2B n=1 Tax=Hydra vulgaris TaxID=6087 RepID=UPI00064108B6|nr:AN1-type zinc finger protein 2B [Hydra vulgaris]